jgi:hypothetical protein
VAAGAVTCLASVSHFLGELAALTGRIDVARRHFATAAAAHREAGCRTLTMASEAAAAALTGPSVDVRIEGNVGTVRYGTTVVRLPRSLGLTYLTALVGNPGTDIPALDLVAIGDGRTPSSAPPPDQPVLDRVALTAYRYRLTELDDEIAEAEEWHDQARLSALRHERDFLLAELSGSLGLGGRPRHFADEAERARINVTRAIRSTIRKIATYDAALGELLNARVTTGRRCRYEGTPDGSA